MNVKFALLASVFAVTAFCNSASAQTAPPAEPQCTAGTSFQAAITEKDRDKTKNNGVNTVSDNSPFEISKGAMSRGLGDARKKCHVCKKGYRTVFDKIELTLSRSEAKVTKTVRRANGTTVTTEKTIVDYIPTGAITARCLGN